MWRWSFTVRLPNQRNSSTLHYKDPTMARPHCIRVLYRLPLSPVQVSQSAIWFTVSSEIPVCWLYSTLWLSLPWLCYWHCIICTRNRSNRLLLSIHHMSTLTRPIFMVIHHPHIKRVHLITIHLLWWIVLVLIGKIKIRPHGCLVYRNDDQGMWKIAWWDFY